MRLEDEERKKLEEEFKELITPKPIMSLEDLKHVDERGAEVIKKLIDDDILKKMEELSKIKEGDTANLPDFGIPIWYALNDKNKNKDDE